VYNETSAKKKLMATVDSGIKKLDAQKARVDKAKDDAQTQLTDIKANRELVKVQKITDKLATQLVDMKTALQSTMAVASDSKTETKSLDDLVAGQASKVDDADFNKIMGK